MRSFIKTLSLVGLVGFLSFLLGLGIAHADGVTDSGAASYVKGSCALNGAATPTCTATVPASCTAPICSYVSSALPHIAVCAVVGTTLTALSATALDSGTVAFICP